MNSDLQQLIAQLQRAKAAGLPYVQAKRQLLAKGYTEQQLAQAAYQFNYMSDGSAKNTYNPKEKHKSVSDAQYQHLGRSILYDRELAARPYSYLLSVAVAGVAVSLYRLYLNQKFREDQDPAYLWINNLATIAVLAIVSALVTIVCLKLYFASQDRKHHDRQAALRKRHKLDQ